MKQKLIYLTAIFFASILILLIIGVIADDQIRPAPQTESRGVGEQIRPANQQSLPSDGNGNYHPTEGSSYSSSVYVAPPVVNIVKLNATLNGTNINSTSNVTGNASFVLNKTSNTLSYSMEFNNLSSNETSAEITIPGLLIQNQTVSYPLQLGNIKNGIITFVQEVENYLLEGKALIRIRSLLFPNGEIGGQILNIPLI